MQLEGKAALVTGGGTGVGRATALELAARGCSVAVNYSRSKHGAEQTAAEAADRGVRSLAIRADVSVDADCRALGRLDVLVNNAGTTSFIPHDDLEGVGEDDWASILGVNLRGPFQCARAARAALTTDGGGEVVNVSSVAGILGTGSSIPYCASKAALNNLTITLARVLAPEVRVNGIAPGFIAGEWLKDGLGPAYEPIKSAMEGRAALGRVCTPEDVAGAIVAVIAGPDLVTGHTIPVEGGMIIGSS